MASAFKLTFSMGNVVTIICGVIFALGLVTTLQINQTKMEERHTALSVKVSKNEKSLEILTDLRIALRDVAQAQNYHGKRLEDIMQMIIKETKESENAYIQQKKQEKFN